jgi:AcrR family transcriptional regulator
VPRLDAARTKRNPGPLTPLSRDRVLRAAIDLADADGIESLSMRRLAQQFGVDPMSLYNHVRNKEDLLEGMVDLVVSDIVPSVDGADWRAQLRRTVMAARAVLLQHPWAKRVIEARPVPGPATLHYLDVVLGILRDSGFSLALTHHTLHVLGSRVLGFSQDLFDDSASVRPEPEVALAQARQLTLAFPRLGELALAATHEGGLGGCDDDAEFAFSLDLILDGLERIRTYPDTRS